MSEEGKTLMKMYKRLILIFIIFIFFLGLAIPAYSANGTTSSLSITSPLKATTFAEFVGEIASYIRDIALVISVIMFLWSGFLFLTSGGNEEKVTKAKKALGWAVIGLAICIIGEGFRFILEQLFKGT